MVTTGSCTESGAHPLDIVATISPDLIISWVHASRSRGGIVVTGRIQQRHCCVNAMRGYVHIEAIDAAGQSVATTDAPWGEFIARQIHSAYFGARLPSAKSEAVSRIIIGLRHDQP